LTPGGEFIFFSNRIFTRGLNRAAERAYLRRFRVCLSNGYRHFTGRERAALQTSGCELFIYLWFNGYYEKELARTEGESSSIRRFPDMLRAFRTLHRRPEWLLNPGRPLRGSGAAAPAFFYDYGRADFRAHFIGFIRERLARTGCDGVFFDYIGGWALPEEVKSLWRVRHPGRRYDAAGVQFLKELRRAIPGLRLFGNQAYRLPPAYYDCLDYDLTESHATSFVWGREARVYVQGQGMQTVRETFYRPWDGPNGYKAVSRPRRERMAGKPRVRVFDLNYLQPWYVLNGDRAKVEGRSVPVYAPRTDRPAIFYGYVLGKLTGVAAFASDWYAPGYGRDDLYFLDLGSPVAPTFRQRKDVVTRYFRKGFVAATRRGGRVAFTPEAKPLPDDVTGLWDVYAQRRVPGWPRRREVVIHPALYPATRAAYPSGRVYLYLFE
jgi:hypothetical protein